jgi:hypothetical protein
MSEDQPADEVEKRALLFESMAAQIRLNKDAKFGGAFLCIPPGAGVEPFSSLMLNQEQPGIFWAAIKTLADMALAETDRQQRQQGFR